MQEYISICEKQLFKYMVMQSQALALQSASLSSLRKEVLWNLEEY